MASLLTFIPLICVTHSGLRGQWDYDQAGKNVGNWSALFPECGYQRQSPIDLSLDNAHCQEPLLLQWESNTEHFAIRNNGHSLQATPFEIRTEGNGDVSGLEVLHHANDTTIKLRNSFYNTYKSRVSKEYCFDSLHFHWGTTNETGSEHTVNGQAYPLEVHLVHYSCDWHLASDALQDYVADAVSKYDDANVLAVVGVLFELGDANPVIDQILDDVIVSGVAAYHDPSEKYGNHLLELFYAEFDIAGLLPTSKEMVAYQGSLTTPPCFETVRWHVMKETMTVSAAQMAKFRSFLESTNVNDTMAPNYRPVQPLNNRTLYQCQEQLDAEEVEKDTIAITDTVTEAEKALQEKANRWFKIAIIFICLFAVCVVITVVLISFVYQLDQARDRERRDYERSMSRINVSPRAHSHGNSETVQMTTQNVDP
eukprot:CAMPEP_0197028526 /NCGR_PEP_ID=MMETSP1384-20130603/8193_1 /TAXON_ID=29189 /ORGANISM="Ammonia sp." /LENGTH=424 /DNA_ID=CAMNT_0042457543 /DNA_START=80 /DNA_END=1354 /DNA_ORIENTATION=-